MGTSGEKAPLGWILRNFRMGMSSDGCIYPWMGMSSDGCIYPLMGMSSDGCIYPWIYTTIRRHTHPEVAQYPS